MEEKGLFVSRIYARVRLFLNFWPFFKSNNIAFVREWLSAVKNDKCAIRAACFFPKKSNKLLPFNIGIYLSRWYSTVHLIIDKVFLPNIKYMLEIYDRLIIVHLRTLSKYLNSYHFFLFKTGTIQITYTVD